MAKIIVCGYMIRHPIAGNLLAYFHYVLGLYRLGHEVCYLEESGWPRSCYDPIANRYGDNPDVGLRTVKALLKEYGCPVGVYYVNRETGYVAGSDWQELKRIFSEADLLLNVGGVCWLPEFRLCRRRALIDMDPMFTQLGRFGAEGRGDYDTFFSYGANIGQGGCSIPTGDTEWLPTIPPVVPEMWTSVRPSRIEGHGNRGIGAPFTTIANWAAYESVEYQGVRYGQKDEEFIRMRDLPSRTTQKLELALSGGRESWTELQTAGWLIRNALDISIDLPSYKAYILDSRGEFSVAKNAYVKTRSGWFSDRSVCYLAAGRPVILQDTGFSDWLRTGRGVLQFSSVAEAAESIDKVNAEYDVHCASAAEIAQEIFSYRMVLPSLIELALTK